MNSDQNGQVLKKASEHDRRPNLKEASEPNRRPNSPNPTDVRTEQASEPDRRPNRPNRTDVRTSERPNRTVCPSDPFHSSLNSEKIGILDGKGYGD